jgi:preprotein translocase subunit SecA
VIEELIKGLAAGSDLTAEEILDVLWVSAIRVGPRAAPPTAARVDTGAPAAPVGRGDPEQPRSETPSASPSPSLPDEEQVTNLVPLRLPPGGSSVDAADDPDMLPEPDGEWNDAPGGRIPATEVGFGSPRPIRDAAGMPRALRRLRQVQRPGPRLAVDIDATVEATADAGGNLVPVFTRPPERSLDMALVVDGAPAMRIWDDTFDEFARLMAQTGAFRSVERWRLIMDGEVYLADTSGKIQPTGRLIDPSGRRVVFVATNASADAWYTAGPWKTLASWCAAMPTALIHVLPRQYWAGTALGEPYITARASRPAAPNGEYTSRLAWWADNPGGTPLPVVTLVPDALETWAQAVVNGTAWTPGITALPPDPDYVPVANGDVSADVLVNDFLSRASPGAERLARILATADTLSMPLIAVLQESLAPQTGVLELAEILSSGMLSVDGSGSQARFRFRTDTRQILCRGVTTFEEWDAYAAVSRYLESQQRLGGPLSALVPDPDGSATLDTADEPFAALHEALSTRLGLRAITNGQGTAGENRLDDRPERQAEEQAERQAGERAERQAGERAGRQAGEQAERQAQEQAERQAGKPAEYQTREQAGRPLLGWRARTGERKVLRALTRIADQVNSIEEDFTQLSDAELRAMTGQFRERLAAGEMLDDLLPEAFATVREATKRTLGQRHFDVQIMGGAALHGGNIAEMKDGEGKTLVATLPSYLNALTGQGVHVVTVNDYLAKRDSEWLGRVHRFLGLEVGVILAQMPPEERRRQYAADITYGTSNEFGFDYLRDNMAWTLDECVQRGHPYAIVDEVDSILIDEARTPLIINGPAEQSAARWYTVFASIAPRLRRSEEKDDGGDYEVDEKRRTVDVLESGVAKVEDWLGIENLYESVSTPLARFLNNAIKAKELYKRDKDYVVMNGEVLIVDESTGRILHGRQYNGGVHQAIEAKEGVAIQNEKQTLATITLQNYFRLYDKLAGMTGTAMAEANEFLQIYKLGVVPIPTNKPMIRVDRSDFVYQTTQAKFDAVVDDIAGRYEAGQPVLVGTTSVEDSEVLSRLLKRHGIPHEVLNAKNHEREAAIIAQAGRTGAVTVVLAKASRGVDITLGGTPQFFADLALHQRGLSPIETPEDYEAAWEGEMEKAWRAVAAERTKVAAAGGLAVLGTERHESRRADDRLRSRAGRRGDPGESQFYLSLEDDLMRRFNSDKVAHFMEWLKTPSDVPMQSTRVSRSIQSMQAQAEEQNFEYRKSLLKYDDVLDQQRKVIYGERHRVLEGTDLHEQIRQMIDEVITAYIAGATQEGFPEEWDLYVLWNAFRELYHPTLAVNDVIEEAGGEQAGLSREFLVEVIRDDAQKAYDRREEELTPEVMRELERRVVLSVLDRKWRGHLYEMDQLREGIGLRRNPLAEYQREGYDLFTSMMEGIKEESVGSLFNLQVEVQESPIVEEAGGVFPAGKVIPADTMAPGGAGAVAGQVERPARLSYSAPSADDGGQVERRTEAAGDDMFAKVGRNDPCPCGSGRRYKLCHGDPRNRSR